MSEYQYYEFRTIEHLLTDDQRKNVASLSSRANVTSHQASFVYHYGDFRGNVKQLMADCFDIMLYITNWGSRRLMFRIPSLLIDMKQLAPFCISEEIDYCLSEDKESIILDLNFHDEEQYDWIEGEGWLDELISLREELILGDFRVLYLAWLKSTKNALENEGIKEDTLEPPVPYGLKNLSNAQKSYISFLDIEEAMIAAGAQISKEQPKGEIINEQWINKLSEKEKYDFLLRLSRSERNLSILLNRRLHELAVKEQPQEKERSTEKRTISTLIELAEEWHQKEKEKERKKEELTRQNKLESLGNKKSEVWKEIYAFIEEKKSNSYDKAVELLNDLHELARHQGELKEFREQIETIRQNYSNRSVLLRRMRNSKLIGI